MRAFLAGNGLMGCCDDDQYDDPQYDVCMSKSMSPPSYSAPDATETAPAPDQTPNPCTGPCAAANLLGPPFPLNAATGSSFVVTYGGGKLKLFAGTVGRTISNALTVVTGVAGIIYVFLSAENPDPCGSPFTSSNYLQPNGVPVRQQ